MAHERCNSAKRLVALTPGRILDHLVRCTERLVVKGESNCILLHRKISVKLLEHEEPRVTEHVVKSSCTAESYRIPGTQQLT
jgi:hypothetical protein